MATCSECGKEYEPRLLELSHCECRDCALGHPLRHIFEDAFSVRVYDSLLYRFVWNLATFQWFGRVYYGNRRHLWWAVPLAILTVPIWVAGFILMIPFRLLGRLFLG